MSRLQSRSKERQKVYVASNEQLTSASYVYRLWLTIKNTPHSRRGWLDVLSAAIYDFEGDILMPDGRYYPIPNVDDVICGKDGSARWISYFIEADKQGLPRRKVRSVEKLRIFDLYFRIAKPHIAAHFDK